MNGDCPSTVERVVPPEVRLARAYLLAVAEPPAPAVSVLVEHLGPVEAAARIRADAVPERVRVETAARREVEVGPGALAAAGEAGMRLVVPEDPEWPAWPLLSLANAWARGLRWAVPPLALWVRGLPRLEELVRRSASVVGARAATAYGEHVAAEFGHGLASAGLSVVSGAAFGIDAAAHRGALAAGGWTVAALAGGVDEPSPAAHAGLLARVARQGLVVSEYPPGTRPARHRFLVRNRLIAALTAGTVVVEAGLRSGARNTASSAAALGKPVLAVPGPVTSAMSAGCHRLLRSGTAQLAASVADVLEGVGSFGAADGSEPNGDPARSGPARATDGLGEEALRVHEALHPRRELSVRQVSAESGLPVERARALLAELELTGLAEEGDGGWRRARLSRR